MRAEQAMFIKFRLQIRILLLIIALGLFDTVSIPSHLSALQPSNTQARLPTEQAGLLVGQVYPSHIYEKQNPALNSYLSLLMKEIGEAVIYPQPARQKNLQGRIELRLQVLNNGHLNQVIITKSSGYKVLDESAKDALKKASPYSQFPPHIKLESLWVKVPIIYIDSPQEKDSKSLSGQQALPVRPEGGPVQQAGLLASPEGGPVQQADLSVPAADQIPVRPTGGPAPAEGGPDSPPQTLSELVQNNSSESQIQDSYQKLAIQTLNE